MISQKPKKSFGTNEKTCSLVFFLKIPENFHISMSWRHPLKDSREGCPAASPSTAEDFARRAELRISPAGLPSLEELEGHGAVGDGVMDEENLGHSALTKLAQYAITVCQHPFGHRSTLPKRPLRGLQWRWHSP